ncbi:MAG: hypothetical protein K0V04_08730 [Deltaproteobacteria bacterium]|nr:hypothetical protein [Deltaproteobacteria bacterium]
MGSTKIMLREHAGGLIQLTAIAPTALSMSVDAHRMEGQVLVVELAGTVRNLPNETACTITWIISADDAPARTVGGGSQKLVVQGDQATLEVRLNALHAELIGRLTLTLELTPDFPPYLPSQVAGAVSIDLPCTVTMDGLSDTMAVGQTVELQPQRHAIWDDCTLRLRITEHDDSDDDDSDPSDGVGWDMMFEWGPGESEPKVWRVGCTDDQGEPVLCLPDPGEQGDAELRLQLQLVTEGSTATLTDDRCLVSRPGLTALHLVAHNEARNRLSRKDPGAAIRWARDQPLTKDLRFTVEAQIDGLASGFGFPVEITLWGRKALPGRPEVEVMEPVLPPMIGHTDHQGYLELTVLDLSIIESPTKLAPLLGYEFFAVLRLPPANTGAETHVPVGQALDYDPSTFAPFLDEDFASEVAVGPQRIGYTRGELATGVCSTDVGTARPLRMPHFGVLHFAMRGKTLVVMCAAHGEFGFWAEAAPEITLALEDGTSIPLETAAQADDARMFEATIDMTDARIVGQCITATIAVTNDSATVDGHRTPDPVDDAETSLDCSPVLGPFSWRVEERGDERIGRLTCQTRYFPTNHPDVGKGLKMEVSGYYDGMSQPVPLGIELRYAIPDGKSKVHGRVGASGLLEATVHDPEQIERIEAGRIQVEAWRPYDDGKVYDIAVPRGRGTIGRGSRSLPNDQIIFASKVSSEFKSRLLLIAEQLHVDPNILMAVMAFETGEKFEPGYYPNKAVGLIQFTGPGAKTVDSTKDALSKLSAEDQLLEVQRYFQYWIDIKGPVTTLEDAYMVVFCPEGIGKPADYVLYSKATDTASEPYYARNSGLDVNRDEVITKLEAAAKVREKFQIGLADLG